MFDCVWKAGPTKDLELFLMIVPDVTLEVTLLSELLRTMRTLEWFFSGMSSDVHSKDRGI